MNKNRNLYVSESIKYAESVFFAIGAISLVLTILDDNTRYPLVKAIIFVAIFNLLLIFILFLRKNKINE